MWNRQFSVTRCLRKDAGQSTPAQSPTQALFHTFPGITLSSWLAQDLSETGPKQALGPGASLKVPGARVKVFSGSRDATRPAAPTYCFLKVRSVEWSQG